MPEEKHEAVESVLGEMLGVAQLIVDGNRAPILPQDLRMWAERIKEAVVAERVRKPEENSGNVAKLRNALEKLTTSVQSYLDREQVRKPLALYAVNCDARDALAAPPRNCDVGSPDEQAERFEALCRRFPHCFPCPVHAVWGEFKEGGTKSCQMIWGQTPFAPAKGGDHA